jgi:hypothetical protein
MRHKSACLAKPSERSGRANSDGAKCVDPLPAILRAVRSVDADDVNELVEQHERPPGRHPRLTSLSSGVRRSRS